MKIEVERFDGWRGDPGPVVAKLVDDKGELVGHVSVFPSRDRDSDDNPRFRVEVHKGLPTSPDIDIRVTI